MVDRAHSTPASRVHRLTGSSSPGAGTHDRLRASHAAGIRSQPQPGAVDEQRSAVDRLARLHGLDAEVIQLADGTSALALRERRLWGRRSDIEDAVAAAMPPKPVRAAMQARMSVDETVVDGVHTIAVTESAGWAAEQRAVQAAHTAALAEHERLEAEIGARLGLPLADKLTRRASARLSRWGRRLAGTPPRTYAGLRAKAAVQNAISEDGAFFDPWLQTLAAAVGADAIRLIEAEAEERFEDDRTRDGELFSLIAQHAPLMAEWDDIDEAWKAPQNAYSVAEPPRPLALYWGALDHTDIPKHREKVPGRNSYHLLYEQSDIDAMREGETPCGLYLSHPDKKIPGPVSQWLPDPRAVARKAEILIAWDAWTKAKAELRDSTGLTALGDRIAGVAARVDVVEDAISNYQPQTFEGLQAKARWIVSTPCPNVWAEHLMRDLCRMPPVSVAPPLQAVPSREVVETYRAFLDLELRFLNWETHRSAHAVGGIFLNNPVNGMHGGDGPPPSSRAATVLTTLGLMPHPEFERLAEAEALASGVAA